MRMFTMETRSIGEELSSQAFLACETSGDADNIDSGFRSVLYFDVEQGPGAKTGTTHKRDLNSNGVQASNGVDEEKTKAGAGGYIPLHAHLLAQQVSLLPIQYSETMTVAAVPNYAEHFVTTCVDVQKMKRFNEKVNFEPFLTPVNYSTSVICYRNSTRRRFKSHVEYEPRVKPRHFTESMFIYPKTALTTYVSTVNYHMDECRRWFKSSVDLRAKMFTTSRIRHEKPPTPKYSVTKTVNTASHSNQSREKHRVNGDIDIYGQTNGQGQLVNHLNGDIYEDEDFDQTRV